MTNNTNMMTVNNTTSTERDHMTDLHHIHPSIFGFVTKYVAEYLPAKDLEKFTQATAILNDLHSVGVYHTTRKTKSVGSSPISSPDSVEEFKAMAHIIQEAMVEVEDFMPTPNMSNSLKSNKAVYSKYINLVTNILNSRHGSSSKYYLTVKSLMKKVIRLV
jgi:hypothetical protein